tara:strand:+ start:5534 stop:6697 length:1164 start_codon:yes stop_codon:yes gene_type:complete
LATTKISNLPAISAVTIDDNIIINDGNSATTRVTFSNFVTSLVGLDLTITGNTTFSGTVSGITLNDIDSVDLSTPPNVGQVLNWNGTSWVPGNGSAYIGDLLDVDTTTDPPTDGQVLTWVDADSKWEPRTVSDGGGGAVDSVNSQTGVVVLDADDISDASTTNQFVTSAQKTSIGTAIQPSNNISVLTNDSNYLTSSTGVTSVNGSSAGSVTLGPDDLDDVASDHKFVSSVQLGLIDNAVQPVDSIGILGDVDVTSTVPLDRQSLVWNDGNSEWEPGDAVPGLSWILNANGTDHYTFSGPGFGAATDDPTIYLMRGHTYKFVNSMNAHPFQIQSTVGQGGDVYSDGITNNAVSNGTLVWEVRMDSPNTLYYQCTAHADMGGTITIIS